MIITGDWGGGIMIRKNRRKGERRDVPEARRGRRRTRRPRIRGQKVWLAVSAGFFEIFLGCSLVPF